MTSLRVSLRVSLFSLSCALASVTLLGCMDDSSTVMTGASDGGRLDGASASPGDGGATLQVDAQRDAEIRRDGEPGATADAATDMSVAGPIDARLDAGDTSPPTPDGAADARGDGSLDLTRPNDASSGVDAADQTVDSGGEAGVGVDAPAEAGCSPSDASPALTMDAATDREPPNPARLWPPSFDFGVTGVTLSSPDQTFTFTNGGTSEVRPAVTLVGSAQFAVGSDACTGKLLAPGATCAVTARFAPTSPGEHMASLTVSSAGWSAGAELTGTAWIFESALFTDPTTKQPVTTVDFGGVLLGEESTSRTVALSNIGTKSVTLQPALLTGPHLSDFRILEDTCGQGPLAPMCTCTVTVAFHPGLAGFRDAVVNVTAERAGSASVTLGGLGLAPLELVPFVAGTVTPTAPAGSPLDFGQAMAGTTPASARRELLILARSATGALNGSLNGAGAPANLRIASVAACQNRVKLVAGKVVTSGLTTAAPAGVVAADGLSFTHPGLDPLRQSDPALTSICVVTVQFAPQSSGDKTGTLSISATTASVPVATHSLKGTGL